MWLQVPLFVPDNSLDPSSLLKQMSAFGMGGWWLGGVHTKPNNSFLQQVQNKVLGFAGCDARRHSVHSVWHA